MVLSLYALESELICAWQSSVHLYHLKGVDLFFQLSRTMKDVAKLEFIPSFECTLGLRQFYKHLIGWVSPVLLGPFIHNNIRGFLLIHAEVFKTEWLRSLPCVGFSLEEEWRMVGRHPW